MLKKKMKDILSASKRHGWVLEPDAKKLFAAAGLSVPSYQYVTRVKDAITAGETIGYPVVGKVVSPDILHKSDTGGVVLNIEDPKILEKTFRRFSKLKGFKGMLVEQTVSGLELIVGAKMDYQFGPVILLGVGGTGVEVYHDTSLRMAPIDRKDVASMINGLAAHEIIEGYRGASPINMEKLSDTLLKFSEVVMDLEDRFESIDLNPVMCSPDACLVADARIILKADRDAE